jgi:radical SAM superfamily enzyme YgiQ (UPF0313 family)
MKIRLIDVAPVPRSKQSFQTLTLPRVAGCTPAEHDVSITDGRVEAIGMTEKADVVGLTFSCNNSQHAYDLARDFKQRGITVVAGGTHTTAVPNEVLEHVDAVLCGEAEGGAWERLLADVGTSRLGGIYRNSQSPSVCGLNPPRVDLFRHPERYIDFSPMEATRGCTHNCSFCFNSAIHGEGFRTRPVEEVVEDARRATSRNLMFMDDNLCGKRGYAKELFRALIPLKKRLFFQSDLLMTEDPELMDLARRAGTQFVFVGIESFEEASLGSVNKSWNKVSMYKEYIDRFHQQGIFVSAGLILGLDNDRTDIFEKTLRYLIDIGVDNAAVNLLIPYPGTPFYEQMKAEGRILTDDTRRYTGFDVVVEPKQMSVDELMAGYDDVLRRFYSKRRYGATMLRTGMWRKTPHIYAMAWWREPRRRTWSGTLNRRGGE